MTELLNSFWKLGRERREQLLWKPLAEILNARHYTVYDYGTRADIYPSLARYSYEIVTRSDGHLRKLFRKGFFNQKTYCGKYTVVNLTIMPPQLEEGEKIYIAEPPTIVQSHSSCTSISTISRGYTILEVKEACLIPYKIKQTLNRYDVSE